MQPPVRSNRTIKNFDVRNPTSHELDIFGKVVTEDNRYLDTCQRQWVEGCLCDGIVRMFNDAGEGRYLLTIGVSRNYILIM